MLFSASFSAYFWEAFAISDLQRASISRFLKEHCGAVSESR
jgi:hypothetical protein